MRILLLAGTQEARLLASNLVKKNFEVIASLNGNTRNPNKLPCETRVGGFGGETGFRLWLKQTKPNLVIDATHPFAVSISTRTKAICSEENIPSILFLRDEWKPKANENWFIVNSYNEIVENITPYSRVFLATGAHSLEKFYKLKECHVFCRKIDRSEDKFPLESGSFIIGRPPFTVEDELRLFKKLNIDFLVVKNSGGNASESKLKAASILGIQVIMLNRPDYSNFNKVSSINGCLDWISNFDRH